MEETGRVKFYDEAKGFGFITVERTNEDVFVHVSGLIDEIKEDDEVKFRVVESKKGLTAVDVERIM